MAAGEGLALLDQAPCGLLATDAKGLILRANTTFCDWVGRPAGELLGQRKLQDLLTMGGRIFHQTHWAPLLLMQGSLSEVKLELRHADGTVVPVVMNAIRRERDGAIVHDVAVFVARDRDKYERELLQSRARFEALFEEASRLQETAKDRALFAEQMVGIVSHDLRNPLSAIQMGATVLSRGDVSPHQLRVLGRMSRAAERANRLIADLLDFTAARIGTGLAVSPLPIDLHAVVAETVEELALAFPGRRLQHLQRGEGPCTADADRLSQLIGNLVGNAMTYGSTEEPVTVVSDLAGTMFRVSVHNRGTPIGAPMRAELFRPMVRGGQVPDSARSVGLGLFIVAEIAKAHGGSMAVESSAEDGTTFTATFPQPQPQPQ